MRAQYPTHLATACLLGVFGLGACAPGDEPRRRNVVLICLDTVRADHLGCYGHRERPVTPFLDSLSASSILFEDASSTAGWTKPSVPSFMTGTFPMQHGVYLGSSRDEGGTSSDVLPAQARTLAEVFQEQGYETAAFVKNAQLRMGMGIEQGFDVYRDEAGDAREIRWQARDWLEERDVERPFFLYLHFLDAHWPYAVPEEYAQRFTDAEALTELRGSDWRDLRDAVNDGRIELGDERVKTLRALYDGSLRFIDDQLALLEKTLEREGLAEDTVICVISDHGEEFLEHGKLGHGHGLWEHLLRVPWILHVPGRGSSRVSEAVSLVDLFPTLLSAAGIASGGPSMGVDRLSDPTQARPVFAEHLEPGSYQQSMRVGEQKIWRTLRSAEGKAEFSPPDAHSLLARGGRWEVRLRESDRAGLIAARIKVSDDSLDDPAELKGPIEEVAAGSVVVCGLTVRVGPATELYGELLDASGAERELAIGMLVKARGSVDAQDVFLADRLKLYADDAEMERELRGPSLGDSDGTLEVAGLPVSVDASTEVSGVSSSHRMDRDDVTRFLEGASEQDEVAGFVESLVYRNLAIDAGELEAPSASSALTSPLRQFSRSSSALRLWGSADRTQLSDEDLRALREIGYAE